jgi:hypothetical protein
MLNMVFETLSKILGKVNKVSTIPLKACVRSCISLTLALNGSEWPDSHCNHLPPVRTYSHLLVAVRANRRSLWTWWHDVVVPGY